MFAFIGKFNIVLYFTPWDWIQNYLWLNIKQEKVSITNWL